MSDTRMNGIPTTVNGSTLQAWMGATEAALAERLSPKLLKKAAQTDKDGEKGWLSVAAQKPLSGRVADQVCVLLQDDVVGVIA